ncbi:hypothetical protein HBI56_043980 [Parastagonospora nodorum]|nr:hypothetical protein HBH56_057110 [Parastagonospora nodorum]KAH3930840.1 hypothetical protein HBH54_101040 [Parastagonospora nodorum]KAH3965327.1 hypothetical protein HBH51_149600 [Parastagonospora nodorum]KAH4011795.1 hypothetical protein HBI09_224960 [Parastagonospora nodorum]KAH4022053.1 hypothetical protein HBI13_097300 [Parastagonospora nodorum]
MQGRAQRYRYSEAVSGEDLVNGLEVGDTSAVAVARSSGGDTLGLGARVERTARVTGLGADVGLSETSDTALSVVDSRAQGADGTAEDTSGGTGTADAGASGGGGASRDGNGATTVVVYDTLVGVSAGGTDEGVVVSGEGRTTEGSSAGTTGGGCSGAGSTAVTSGDETGGDRETDRASAATVDEVCVTTTDGGKDGWQGLNSLDLVLTLDKTGLLGEVSSLGTAAGKRLEHKLVRGDIDVVGGDAAGSLLRSLAKGGDVHLVESFLGVLELLKGSVNDERLCASGGDIRGQGLVGNGDTEVTVNEPSTSERGAGSSAELLDDIGGLELTSNTGVGLSSVKSKVALHGSQDLGVEGVGSGGRGAIYNGQEDCESSEEAVDLHDGGIENETEEARL